MDKMTNMADAPDLSQKQPDSILGMQSPGEAPPKYPGGLKIYLSPKDMAKLGIAEVPKIGEEVTIQAKAYVCQGAEHENKNGGMVMDMAIQITDMAVGLQAEKQDDAQFKQAASKIYGDQNATLVSVPGEYS